MVENNPGNRGGGGVGTALGVKSANLCMQISPGPLPLTSGTKAINIWEVDRMLAEDTRCLEETKNSYLAKQGTYCCNQKG